MSRGTFLGGSTVVTLSERGTKWSDGFDREAAELFDRWDTRDQVQFDKTVRRHNRHRKEFIYFMRACALAFEEETLSRSFPPAPKWLAREVKKSGGTIEWLQADRGRVVLLSRFIRKVK